MKTWFNKLFFMSMAPILLWSCKKDENKLILENGTQQTLTASSSAVVLSLASETKEALVLAWNAVDYTVPTATSYTLQLDKSGGNFTEPIATLSVGTEKKKSYTHGELNKVLLLGGIPAGSPSDIQFRIKSEITGVSSVAPQYSKVVTVTITPYLVKVDYPALYVPGSYQDWAPDKAKKLAAFDKLNDKAYEGYIYIKDDNAEFKFTDANDWAHGIYGDNGDGTTHVIQSPGNGNNCKSGDLAGYYWLKCDLKNLTWSATRTTWGLIGSITPPSYNWSDELAMTLDPVTGIWSITGDFKAGAFKFRANGNWDINYGDKDGDGILDFNKNDLNLATDGKYKIELDLTDAGNYTYKVTKQ
ncbi:MAG: SusE domain-containing protein [Sphingobacteriales bacterium]